MHFLRAMTWSKALGRVSEWRGNLRGMVFPGGPLLYSFVDVQGFKDADEIRNSAGDCKFSAGPEIQLEIVYSEGVRRYPEKYQKIFFLLQNNNPCPPKPDTGFRLKIFLRAHSGAGDWSLASQVLLKGTIRAG